MYEIQQREGGMENVKTEECVKTGAIGKKIKKFVGPFFREMVIQYVVYSLSENVK